MNHDLEVSQSIDIHATPEKVWDALTNPEIIKEYLFGTKTTTDWQVGSPVTFSGEYNGTTYTDKGTILENIPGQKLSYSYWSSFSGTEDKAENYSRVTYTVTPKENGVTSFTWAQKGYANEAGHEHSKNGMADFLKQIKDIVERQ
jgi:uncharacterized protein YndB with AHSA1/START domain